MNARVRSQIALALALLGAGATLTACSGSSTSSASPSMTSAEATTAVPTTGAPTASPAGGPCSAQVIAAALPNGAKVLSFDCANVSGTQWAAVKVDPGPTVFFLQWSNGSWDVSTADEICGTASAGLPPKLLNYCTDTSGGGSQSSADSTGTTSVTPETSVSPS